MVTDQRTDREPPNPYASPREMPVEHAPLRASSNGNSEDSKHEVAGFAFLVVTGLLGLATGLALAATYLAGQWSIGGMPFDPLSLAILLIVVLIGSTIISFCGIRGLRVSIARRSWHRGSRSQAKPKSYS